MSDPPVEAGAEYVIVAKVFPSVAVPIVGTPGTTAFDVYESEEGLFKLPLFVGTRVIDPATVGRTVNVCVALELLKVKTIGEIPVLAVPVAVIVIVPL